MKISKMFKGLFLSLVVVLPVIFSGCATDEVKVAEGPAMWEVTSKDGDTTLYLFGSIHVADYKAYPFRDDVIDAFEESDYLAVEADMVAYGQDQERIMNVNSQIQYDDGTTIEDHISEEAYENAKAVMAEYNSYNPIMDTMKPYIWSSTILDIVAYEVGLHSERGIDTYFINEANDSEKEILEIESVEFQVDMLLGAPDEYYDMEVNVTEEDMREGYEGLDELYNAWLTGDIEKLEEICNEVDEDLTDEEKALIEENNKITLIDRNVGMVEKAEEYLEEDKNVFYVVGTLHMVGDDGIVELLRDKGYTVTRV